MWDKNICFGSKIFHFNNDWFGFEMDILNAYRFADVVYLFGVKLIVFGVKHLVLSLHGRFTMAAKMQPDRWLTNAKMLAVRCLNIQLSMSQSSGIDT